MYGVMVSESGPPALLGQSAPMPRSRTTSPIWSYCYQRVRSLDSYLARDDALLTYQPLKPVNIRTDLLKARRPELFASQVDPKSLSQRGRVGNTG